MKAQRNYPKLIITKKGTRWVEGGHPWIYEAEVIGLPKSADGKGDVVPENGSLVDAVTEGGKYLGTGFFSEKSKIRVRLISKNANDSFDDAFWKRRLSYAWNYRKQVMGDDTKACRLIFGEADQFPGLTVDRYNDLLVAEVLSVGIERIKERLFDLLVEALAEDGVEIHGIYERNEAKIRELEGLRQYKGWYLKPEGKEHPELTGIIENGVRYHVDVENGQKTGFFLDQKYNRKAVAGYVKGLKVLDCFTHTGSFALNAAKGGAAHVTAVDVSQTAIDMAKANAELNGLTDRMDFVCSDVFELLTELEKKGSAPYDFIILDPPAFTKSRDTVKNAKRGYKDINYRALKLLPRGGYLATASCSHFMEDELFVQMLREAAHDAGKALRQIEARQQSPDHPILWNVPETAYLKFYIFQVI